MKVVILSLATLTITQKVTFKDRYGGEEDDDKEPNGIEDFSQLRWKFEPLTEVLQQPVNMYSGPGPCLRRGVGSKFQTLLGAAEVCGGFSREFIKRLTAHSNHYAQEHMDGGNRFGGSKWLNIFVQDMYHFLGVILKMSIGIGRWVDTSPTTLNPPFNYSSL